jgi:hypothetical protein
MYVYLSNPPFRITNTNMSSKQYLFAVNAGSNSVSMFYISPWNPTKLFLLGQPGVTTGDFPNSVAVSSALNIVCAGHSGPRSGISCASFSPRGLGPFDALRPFNLGQVEPPTGPFNGVGDTFFSLDSSLLITTVKGNPAANDTGFVSIFPVTRHSVSYQGTRTSPSGTVVLFGGVEIPGTSDLFLSDASFGALTLSLNSLATPLTTTKIPDQRATCWAKVSPATGTGFVTDPGINHLVNIDLASGAIIQEFNSMNGNPGMIDFVVVGTKIYALAPGNGNGIGAHVAVFDVENGIKDVQNFVPPGADVNAQGMAVLAA